MNKYLITGVAVILVGVGGWYAMTKPHTPSATISHAQLEKIFLCPSANEYVQVSAKGVVTFSKNGKPIPSKVYLTASEYKTPGVRYTPANGPVAIYHDDQYDPALQRDNIPALYECTHEGKNFFEVYSILPDWFENEVNRDADKNPLN